MQQNQINHIEFVTNLIKDLLDNNFTSYELEALSELILRQAKMMETLERLTKDIEFALVTNNFK